MRPTTPFPTNNEALKEMLKQPPASFQVKSTSEHWSDDLK